ncbi:MAG: ABC transporter permease [Bacilli bacterium]|nr:ABC transporter permease [Bacilli bacterium]
MTVFKTFLKVLNKAKAPIIMYTVFLIFFSAFNMQTADTTTNFTATKPDVLIINNDEEKGLTKNLVNYIKRNSNIIDIKNNENAIRDALFYRDLNYIIYIPKDFRKDFLAKKNPEIKIKKTTDYNASLAEMQLSRYLKVANTYLKFTNSEEDLIRNINQTLKKQAKVEIVSKLDTSALSKATFYYNFLNYCLLAGFIYVICLILSSFKEKNIHKRTIISSMNYKEYNRKLLLSNALFGFVLWLFYIILSFIILGSIIFTPHGLVYILNSFIFSICALSIAFLIGNAMNNKNAINGIVNVVALGSCFLCGAFVPMELLPDSVLKIAHILPSYWYIKTNELLKTIDKFNLETMSPILINMLIIIAFTIVFVVITNIISLKKQKID